MDARRLDLKIPAKNDQASHFEQAGRNLFYFNRHVKYFARLNREL